jgi:ABC-2 type transport system permease protein
MDKWLLRFVFLFERPFQKQGINTVQMRKIVETKLLMDKRRSNFNFRLQQSSDSSNHLSGVLFVYGIMSAFLAFIIGLFPSFILAMIFFHSYIIFMMAMTLITDFSSVMLDTKDNLIILPKPINSRTVFMARMVHILIYIFQFTIAFGLLPIVVVFFKYGVVTGLAIIITTLLAVLLSIFLTYFLYLLIIRFTNEQKLKEVITYFQIFMTMFFVVGYQILPRLINFNEISASFSLQWYSYLLPPVWMAVALEAVYKFNFDMVHVSMILISLILPVLLFWVLIRYLSPYFTQKIAAMGQENNRLLPPVIKEAGNSPIGISKRLSVFFCSTLTERASFNMVWKMTGRDKSFRLQFYPTLSYIFVFIFIFVFKAGRNMTSNWQQLPDSNSFLWFIYLPMLTISSSLMLISYHENFEAAWIYYSTPIRQPGELITGAVKAMFIKYFMPLYLFLFCFSFYIWGVPVVDDFLTGLFTNLFLFLFFVYFSTYYLPFSRQPNVQDQTGKFLIVILQLIVIGLLVGLHYLIIKQWWWLSFALLIPAYLLSMFFLRKLRGLLWRQIKA